MRPILYASLLVIQVSQLTPHSVSGAGGEGEGKMKWAKIIGFAVLLVVLFNKPGGCTIVRAQVRCGISNGTSNHLSHPTQFTRALVVVV
jgi:hypothetical protein